MGRLCRMQPCFIRKFASSHPTLTRLSKRDEWRKIVGMKQIYHVTVFEQFRKDVAVEAMSEEQAVAIAENSYANGRIQISDRDYDGPAVVLQGILTEEEANPYDIISAV